jgi:hypothetical protein
MSNPERNRWALKPEESSSAAAVEKALRLEEDSHGKEILDWGVDIVGDNPAEGPNYFIWRYRPDDSNLPDTSELKVDVFPEDDKAESAVLAALAGRTCIAWGPAIIGKKRQIILISRPGPAVPVGPQDALSRLLAEAKADVGRALWKDDRDTNHGQLGCADAVSHILHELGFSVGITTSTKKLYDELVAAGWQKIDVTTSGVVVPPGAVIVSPTCSAMHGHTGIVSEKGRIYSNRSKDGLWGDDWTVNKWKEHYARCGVYAFVPPAQAAPRVETGRKPMTFNATRQPVNGSRPPIRFLEELVAWARSAADEIFAPNASFHDDIYDSVSHQLGPCEGIATRRAVMLEVLRVLAGIESTWNWNDGVDKSKRKRPTAENSEAGAWQVSADSMIWGKELKDLVQKALARDGGGSLDANAFQRVMKKDHQLAIEYAARLLRHTTKHHGPVKRHEIHPWLSKDAVAEFQELV